MEWPAGHTGHVPIFTNNASKQTTKPHLQNLIEWKTPRCASKMKL
jgi:hypothetical protein